jgi:hypothetical protein
MSYEQPAPGAEVPPPSDAPTSNGLGLAGFIVSCAGLCTGGFLCPIGFVLSLVGLRKEPKGLAIAGVVIGALGSLLAIVIVAILFIGTRLEKTVLRDAGGSGLLAAEALTGTAIAQAQQAIEMDRVEKGRLPETDAGNALIAPLKDGWQRAMRYEKTGDEFLIRSAGPDGEFGTVDDPTSAR